MNGSVFYSGQYKKFCVQRLINVNKMGCKSVLMRGITQALTDKKRQSVKFSIDGIIQKGWKRKNDRITLPVPLSKGIYTIDFEIIYNYLDRAKSG